MWWILVLSLGVLVSAALALAFRGRTAQVRFDRSVDDHEAGRPTP